MHVKDAIETEQNVTL